MNSEDNGRLPRCQDAPQDAPHHIEHLNIWRLNHPHQARTFQVSPRHRGGEEETADNDNVSRAASYSTVNRSPRREPRSPSISTCDARVLQCAQIHYHVLLMRAHHVPSSKYQALLVQIKCQQQALDESDTRLVLVLGFRCAQMSIEQIQTDVHDVHGGKYN